MKDKKKLEQLVDDIFIYINPTISDLGPPNDSIDQLISILPVDDYLSKSLIKYKERIDDSCASSRIPDSNEILSFHLLEKDIIFSLLELLKQ